MEARMQRLVTGILLFVVLAAPPARAAEANPAAGAGTPDVSGGGVTRETPDLAPVPFDSVTTALYRQTALALARALATGDAKSYRALHTDAGWAQADDWWQAMLANQKERFGGVARIEGPLRGVIRAGTTGVGVPRHGAAILVRFAKPMGASMSFTLDSTGKIVTSSLWIQDWLAAADTGGAEVLWEAKRKEAGR
jgi:hypothetical protein